jgi:hypothetical protein
VSIPESFRLLHAGHSIESTADFPRTDIGVYTFVCTSLSISDRYEKLASEKSKKKLKTGNGGESMDKAK